MIKRTNNNWSNYLDELVELNFTDVLPPKGNGKSLKDLHRREFAGYLLRRDMAYNCAEETMLSILKEAGFYAGDLLADALINRSQESITKLLDQLTASVIEHYTSTMQNLLDERHEAIMSQPKDDPRDDYDPNLNDLLHFVGGSYV
jgi:hypothetical protein